MRIVTRQEFLGLPEGTVFSKYEPCYFENLLIKGETIGNIDFFYQQINDSIKSSGSDEFFEKLEQSREDGYELTMDFDTQGRDGMFDEDQLFAVWSTRDVEALVIRLQQSIESVEAFAKDRR